MSQNIGTTIWLARSFARLRGTSSSSQLNKVAFLTIFLVCYVSLVGITITTTLRDSTLEQLIQTTGHIVLRAPYATLNIQKIDHVLREERIPLLSYIGYRYAYGCIENEKTGASSPVIFKITDGTIVLSGPHKDQERETNPNILVTRRVAQQLKLHSNQPVSLHILNLSTDPPGMQTIPQVLLRTDPTQQDTSALQEITAIVTPQIMQKNGIAAAPTHMALQLSCNQQTERIAAQLQQRISPIEVIPWFSLFPSMQDALVLEKIIEFCCLAILFSLSTLSLWTCFKMIILTHTKHRYQLKQWGFSRGNIRVLYMLHGLFLSCAACACALAVAVISIALLNTMQYHGALRLLPQTVIVFKVPWKYVLLIPLTMLCITLLIIAISLYFSLARRNIDA